MQVVTCSATNVNLTRYRAVQKAKQAFFTARMAQRALRSDTAADRCVNLAAHMSERHGRIHASFF